MTQYHSSSVGGPNPVGVPTTGTTQRFIVSRSGLHWPAIICGVFLTLTLFIIAGVLSQAVGVDFTFNSVRSIGAEVGTIIWGGVAAFICFGLGAYLAARVARGHVGAGSATLNGFIVWAVAVPILIYVLGGGIGPMLGKKAPALTASGAQATLMDNSVNTTAMPQTHTNNGPNMNVAMSTPGDSSSSGHIGHYRASAWWMLVSLGCGLIGAVLLGVGGTHKGGTTDEVRTSEPVV